MAPTKIIAPGRTDHEAETSAWPHDYTEEILVPDPDQEITDKIEEGPEILVAEGEEELLWDEDTEVGLPERIRRVLGKGSMKEELAEAIKTKQDPPRVLSIVNEPVHGRGEDVSGPNLWECMAPYFSSPPNNLMALLAGFIRMYHDLERRGMSTERWEEIRNYLALQLKVAIEEGHLGNNNLGLLVARDAKEVSEEIDRRVTVTTKGHDFKDRVVKALAARHGNLGVDRIIPDVFGVTVKELVDAHYEQAVAAWRSQHPIKSRLTNDKKVREILDRPHTPDTLGDIYTGRLSRMLTDDLEPMLARRWSKRRWSNLRRVPLIGAKLAKMGYGPNLIQAIGPELLAGSTQDVARVETARVREEELTQFKNSQIELFGGELMVGVANLNLKLQLQTLADFPGAKDIFELTASEFAMSIDADTKE